MLKPVLNHLPALAVFGVLAATFAMDGTNSADKPVNFSESYLEALADDQAVYRIDPDLSRADIVTGKTGWLSRFGHQHVITARPAEGYLLLTEDLAGSHADLRFDAKSLEVDSVTARARQGLDPGPSKKDIGRTRANMLEHVLEAARWPVIHIRISYIDGQMPQPVVVAEIDLHGMTRKLELPVSVQAIGMDLTIKGAFELAQSDFGIKPFKAIGGGIRVSDSLQIRFEIIANLLKVHD
jgi:polyisoprenoid-binding protein YceI